MGVKRESAKVVLLDFQVTPSFQPSSFSLGVSPNDIAALIGLEIPGCDENDISFTYPNAFLQGSTDSAES
jgi:hypothetical protein